MKHAPRKRIASNYHIKPCPYGCGREIKGNAGMASHVRRHHTQNAVREVLSRPPAPPSPTWNTETKAWEMPTKLVPVDPSKFRQVTAKDIDWFGEGD